MFFLITIIFALPASSQTVGAIYRIVSSNTGEVMTNEGNDSLDAAIVMGEIQETDKGQMWALISDGDGENYGFFNIGARLNLDMALESKNPGKLLLWKADLNNRNQVFNIHSTGTADLAIQMLCAENTDLVVTEYENGDLWMETDNFANTNTYFELKEVMSVHEHSILLPYFTYQIRNLNTGLVLSNGGNNRSRAKIIAEPAVDKAFSQMWKLSIPAYQTGQTTWYQLLNEKCGMCIDCSFESGAVPLQWSPSEDENNANWNQMFEIVEVEDLENAYQLKVGKNIGSQMSPSFEYYYFAVNASEEIYLTSDVTNSDSYFCFSRVNNDTHANARVTDLSMLSNDKVYFIKSERAFLLYSAANADNLSTSTGSSVGSIELNMGDPNQQFKIEKKDSQYYLYSVGAEKYVGKDGKLEVSTTTPLKITAVSNENYPWKLCLGDQGLNTQGPKQTPTGIKIDGWTITDAGNCFYIEEVIFDTSYPNKYNVHVLGVTDDTAGVIYNSTVYGNNATIETDVNLSKNDFQPVVIDNRVPVVTLDGFNVYVSYFKEDTKFYTIQSGLGGYVSINPEYIDENGAMLLTNKVEPNDNCGLWTFVKTGSYYKVYNYSTGLSKVVGIKGAEANARTLMVDPSNTDYETTFSGVFNFGGSEASVIRIYDTSHYWNKRGNYLALWQTSESAALSDIGCKFYIKEVDVADDIEPSPSLEVTPDDLEGWNDLSRPHKLALEGTYESYDGLDGVIEYAVEDSEEWFQLTEMLPSGSTFTDSLVVMFDPTREKHVIRFRTRDNVGNTTLLPSIEYLDVSFHEYTGIVDKIYTGDSIYQDITCVDVEGMQVSTGKYSDNVNAGNATFYIEGVYPYTIGRKVCSFYINPAQLTGSIDLLSDSIVYNGQEHFPDWVFTNESYDVLEESKDYSVSYIDNIYPGIGKICVVGKGNYTSQLEKTFFIDKAQLSNDLYSITLPAEDICFDENEHKASATTTIGVGEVKFTYTLHDDTEILQTPPVDEGHYDVYCEIADGDLFYGKANEYVGSFAIYRFDETEWESLCVLYAELQQMNVPLSWNIAGGVKSVGTFEGLCIKEGHVVSVFLEDKGMVGLFPNSLMSFKELENINLSKNNLSGDIAIAIAAIKKQNPLAFNSLKTLDISNNQYKGNIGLLANCMSNLTTLNVSNNKIEDLYPALPSSITELDISHQKMERVVNLNMSELTLEEVATKVPTILLYDQENRTYKNSVNLLCTKAELATLNKYDTEEWAMQLQISDNQISIPYVSAQNAYYGESGDTLNVLNMVGDNATDGCSFRIALSFNEGDANFVNGVDATDLQTTILYAFGGYRNYPFNFTAADTYKDCNINVQDIICTVNILLDSDAELTQETRSKLINNAKMSESSTTDTDAYVYFNDGKVFLHSRVPVASLSIKASGDLKWNIDRTGLIQSTSKGNVVAYSLNGTTIPSSEDVILGEYTNATLYSVSLSDADAQPISVGLIGDHTTHIINTSETSNEDMMIYDISGYKMNSPRKGINVIRINGTTKKVYKK